MITPVRTFMATAAIAVGVLTLIEPHQLARAASLGEGALDATLYQGQAGGVLELRVGHGGGGARVGGAGRVGRAGRVGGFGGPGRVVGDIGGPGRPGVAGPGRPGGIAGVGRPGGWYGDRWNGGYWPGLAVGAITGAALGGYYGGYGYDNGYYGSNSEYSPDAAAYCAQRFKSYDPSSGTYLGYDRVRHPCP